MALKEQLKPKQHYYDKVRRILDISNRLRHLITKKHYYTYGQLAYDLGVTKQTAHRLVNIDNVSDDFIKRLEQLEQLNV